MDIEIVRQINMSRFNPIKGDYENCPIIQIEGVYSSMFTAEKQLKRLKENEELNKQAPNMYYFIRTV